MINTVRAICVARRLIELSSVNSSVAEAAAAAGIRRLTTASWAPATVYQVSTHGRQLLDDRGTSETYLTLVSCMLVIVSCAEVAQPIDLPFGLRIWVGQRKHEFNCIRQVAPICLHGRAHWRHLANTIEQSVCGGDAALCQITLTTRYLWPRPLTQSHR